LAVPGHEGVIANAIVLLALPRRFPCGKRKRLYSRNEASVIFLLAALLANARFSQSIEDVVEFAAKLRVARKCVAEFLEPLDREIRSDIVQVG
jgi:hypothetical protein